MVGLKERLNVYSTMLRSADGQRMIPILGFSLSRFKSRSKASKYISILPTNSGWKSTAFNSMATRHRKAQLHSLHFVQSLTALIHSDREHPIVQLAIAPICPDANFLSNVSIALYRSLDRDITLSVKWLYIPAFVVSPPLAVAFRSRVCCA